MENDLALDVIYGVWKEDGVFEFSDTTLAEELQLQEILKESITASEMTRSETSSTTLTPQDILSPSSEEGLERAWNFKSVKEQQHDEVVAVACKKPLCTFCGKESCKECTLPSLFELASRRANKSGLSNCSEKGRKNFTAGRHQRTQSKFNGGKMGDIPQITSSNAFLAKTSGKEKGITVEDDLLLISNRKLNSRTKARNKSSKKPDSHRPNPIKYSNHTNITAFKKHEVPNVDEDDYIMSDDGSDTSQNSQESRKWFKEFFEKLDSMNIQEIAETKWHCPACADGPGAGKWYRTIQDLITHAKKIVTKRVKLHRELAELLDLSSKITSIPPSGEVACKVKGLKENAIDHEIIWPPMVVIMNTRITIDEDGKFVVVGSQSLLELFSSYPVLKVKHSYGPEGHRGLSVLIFESSAVGYLEAERLHKNFVDQGLDRIAWNSAPDDVFLPLPGEEQLYGFIAVKEDLDNFNKHHQDKSKIKYELKSYQEIVLNNIKQMSEDNQQLMWLKDALVQKRKHSKTLDELVHNLRRNLQQKITDIHIFVKRVQLLHEQNKEEMDFQENFYQDQIKTLEAKVKELERLQESKTL